MPIVLGAVFLILLLLFTLPHKGFMVTFSSISIIVALQYLVPIVDFTAVRGILMVFSMKISSLAFDKGHDFSIADVVPAFAFIFNPSTMIFGPFHTYTDFLKSLNRRTMKEEVSSGLQSVALLAVALGFLMYSSCLSIIVPQGSLLTDYFVAQSFRSSHFFVCFLSQALSTLFGMRLLVCSPSKIELPRSLVEVVTEWNIPMHRYLRSYVYLKFLESWGNAGAIFASFAVSSLLHGLNFQITAVLLSLGFLCYFENKFRNRVSNRFSMCVRARPCGNCNHKKNSTNWQTLLLNVVFSINAVYLLIYLGAPFGEDGAEVGYDRNHTISTWKRHGFAGHWIGIGIALLSICA
ncbi:hypothetical protein KIN20_011158 [Parelaphostrongylus tenuis]|uniref:Protein-serine O-palmitoleoyltransferase porcupine n=1 Tax=Parelaphostrongylus tenuis TaxID=148309 RepID=A0AAD5MCF7_PARTN|nr:hypothetical protein KIN20_011158 [Parelaphostrongylus tenuis]